VAADRHSEAEDAALLSDPDEIAHREAENGLRQFTLALDIIRSHVKDAERPFKLRAGPIMQLHQAALDGLHRLAGTFRNTPVKIHGSLHQPPGPHLSLTKYRRYANTSMTIGTRARFILLLLFFGR
jgi:hypothetical protein